MPIGTTEIRDNRLYRAEFERFEDYCQERWGFNADYARKTIAACDVREGLAEINTIVSILPVNEAQCRPLTKLRDELVTVTSCEEIRQNTDPKKPATREN